MGHTRARAPCGSGSNAPNATVTATTATTTSVDGGGGVRAHVSLKDYFIVFVLVLCARFSTVGMCAPLVCVCLLSARAQNFASPGRRRRRPCVDFLNIPPSAAAAATRPHHMYEHIARHPHSRRRRHVERNKTHAWHIQWHTHTDTRLCVACSTQQPAKFVLYLKVVCGLICLKRAAYERLRATRSCDGFANLSQIHMHTFRMKLVSPVPYVCVCVAAVHWVLIS